MQLINLLLLSPLIAKISLKWAISLILRNFGVNCIKLKAKNLAAFKVSIPLKKFGNSLF